MAITYVGATAGNQSGANLGTADPTGAQDGDLMILAVATDTNHNSNATPGSGWVKVAEQDVGTDSTLTVCYKIRSGAESSTLTNFFDASETGRIVIVAYRGVDQTTPLDVTSLFGSTSGTAWDTSPITPVTDGCMVVAIWGTDPPATNPTFTWDAGITERIDSDTTPSGVNNATGYITIGDKIVSPAAATALGGDASASDTPAGCILALRPAVAATNVSAAVASGTAATVAPPKPRPENPFAEVNLRM